MAKEYINEMGNLHNKFKEYRNFFKTKKDMLDNKDVFVRETTKIINLL